MSRRERRHSGTTRKLYLKAPVANYPLIIWSFSALGAAPNSVASSERCSNRSGPKAAAGGNHLSYTTCRAFCDVQTSGLLRNTHTQTHTDEPTTHWTCLITCVITTLPNIRLCRRQPTTTTSTFDTPRRRWCRDGSLQAASAAGNRFFSLSCTTRESRKKFNLVRKARSSNKGCVDTTHKHIAGASLLAYYISAARVSRA